jgi:Rrf2 family protein
MLQVTKRGDYAVLAVYHIALRPKGQFVSINDVAARSHIPRSYLAKILQDLCRGGILLSHRGAGGGFTLARSAREISLHDILEIIEGKLSLVACTGPSDYCDRSDSCLTSPIWRTIQDFFNEMMLNVTIEDLLDSEKRHHMLTQLETCRKQYRKQMLDMQKHYREQ